MPEDFPHSNPKTRKRASKACLYCRRRKVRCDVMLRGSPCMNCYLDGEACCVDKRKRRGLGAQELNWMDEQTPQSPQHAHVPLEIPPIALDVQMCSSSEGSASIPEIPDLLDVDDYLISTFEGQSPSAAFMESDASPSQAGAAFGAGGSTGDDLSPLNGTYDNLLGLPFIKRPEIDHLSPPDFNFLQASGCFDLPPTAAMDELFRLYFLYLHPVVPLIDEADFWMSYTAESEGDKVSLVTVQAMLFAGSTVIPSDLAESIGFSSAGAAADALYKKAKLLYDFDAEQCPLALAQVAILLTFHAGNQNRSAQSNTFWLSKAIQHYKTINIPMEPEDSGDPVQREKHRILMRRIWWCCITRDRTLSLALHRELQIMDDSPLLSIETDFKYDVGCPYIRCEESQREMHEMFLNICRLSRVITTLLRRMTQDTQRRGTPSRRTEKEEEDLFNCEKELDTWYEATQQRFPSQTDPRKPPEHWFIVHRSFMYAYYYAAKLSLCHCLLSKRVETHGGESSADPRSVDIRTSINGLVDHIEEPLQRGLIQYLPMTVVAFAAVPLLIHMINAKLQSKRLAPNASTSSARQLRILIALVRRCYARSAGVNVLCSQIRRLVESEQAGLDMQGLSHTSDYLDKVDIDLEGYIRLPLVLYASMRDGKVSSNEVQI